jgi:hypothetical protein
MLIADFMSETHGMRKRHTAANNQVECMGEGQNDDCLCCRRLAIFVPAKQFPNLGVLCVVGTLAMIFRSSTSWVGGRCLPESGD